MKVERHIYTRAAKTLYSAGEGYGTVYKTDGLEDAFVKERLHPYCAYPVSLQNNNLTAVTLVNFPCGRMLLGQGRFDAIGERGAFFVHNFVLPAEKAAAVAEDISILPLVDFESDVHADALPLIAREVDSVPLDAEWLSVLAKSITASVYSAKKTYVILPDDDIDFVWNVLRQVYPLLDIEVRQVLGFTTYACQPVNKEGLHLIFITANGAKNPKLSQEFVLSLRAQQVGRSVCFSDVPLKKFLSYINLLHVRLPKSKDYLHLLETKWLDANLDKLSMLQISAIPDELINRGKQNKECTMHVVLGILKFIIKSKNFSHYNLYVLSDKTKQRIKTNIKRLFGVI